MPCRPREERVAGTAAEIAYKTATLQQDETAGTAAEIAYKTATLQQDETARTGMSVVQELHTNIGRKKTNITLTGFCLAGPKRDRQTDRHTEGGGGGGGGWGEKEKKREREIIKLLILYFSVVHALKYTLLKKKSKKNLWLITHLACE